MGSVLGLNGRLDAVNFFLADVRGGLGPYVSVYLLTAANWDQATIGAVLTASGLIGICAHAPIGALIDATHSKRALLVIAALMLAVCAIAIERAPIWPVVFAADITMAILGAVFAPTVASLTLGLMQPEQFSARIGRNAVFDRIGNVLIAAVAGFFGWWLGQRSVFWLVPVFALPAIAAILSIPASAIDHVRARALVADAPSEGAVAGVRLLMRYRAFMALCLLVAAFHFANASLLPLVAQKLALAHPGAEAAFVSACVLTAQFAAIPTGWFVARRAADFSHWKMLFFGCLLLPLRALIFAMADDPVVLVAAQVLDGLGAGLFDTLMPLLLADLMRGAGHYSLSRGVAGFVQGVAGSLSNVVSGVLVVAFGYATAFLALAAVSLVAVAIASALALRVPALRQATVL